MSAHPLAGESVHDSEERFRLLAESNPSIMWMADSQGRLTYVSEQWYRFTGLARGPQPESGWATLALHPEDLGRVTEAWKSTVASGAEYEAEVRARRSDGIYRWFVVRAHPLKDSTGRVAQWFGSTTDIHDRRESEDAARFLAKASEVLSQVGDYESSLARIAELAVPSIADWFGVHIRESDGTVRRVAVSHADDAKKRAVEELYSAYPPGEGAMYGAPAVIAANQALFLPSFEAAAPRVARDARHLELLLALGLRSMLCVPMRSRGQVVGALTLATAESGREYSELHLRAAEDLANRAAVAIENAQLVEALREADRRKDEFLAMLAHELRNPLAPVRNAVQILRDKASAVPEARWAHDVIDRQVRQMSRLVDDLLDVSRITSGKIELRRERVALAAAIQAAVESSRPFIERGRHELAIDMLPEPLFLDADFARLTQVASNLLNNAAKYTPAGGHIRLVVERDDPDVVIRVVDDGIGIPSDMLLRIFEMFVQLDRGAAHSQGGLGIGLTLVRQLVDLHGGSVKAFSGGPGKGSEFVVRLPLSRSEGGAGLESGGADVMIESGSGVRVLVVDDNRDSADSLAILLKARGSEVRVAYDGEEAVELARSFEPDVALLDLGLPKLPGLEVARRIRKARGQKVLLVAVTGWGQEENRRQSREAGFDHHFTKPVDLQALLKLIREAPLVR